MRDSRAKTTAPATREALSAALRTLSEAVDAQRLQQTLGGLQAATGASQLQLILADERLSDLCFTDGTVACSVEPLPAPANTCAAVQPLRVGEECLGELRLHHPRGAAPPPVCEAEAAAHLLTGLLRAARAEKLRATLRSHEGMQQILVHDLRSPLATLRAYLELIAEELPADSAAHEYLVACRRAAAQQEDLLAQMLALYEIGQGVRCARSLAIHGWLVAALAEHEDAAALAGLRLIAELDIPARLRMQTEERPLRRALFNLLANAIRYTPAGGTVQLCATLAAERLWLRVRDDGPGVSAELRERLFTPFARAPVTGVAAGSGLGLAYAKAAIERLGGGIRWEETAAGSEFALWLPLN